VKSFISPYLNFKKKEVLADNHTIANNLFKKYTAFVAILFVIGSFTPVGTHAEMYDAGVDSFAIDPSVYEVGIIADNDGYLTKFNPQTTDTDRTGMTDKFVHVVKSGESLSTIANSYGLKTKTLLWENNLSNANTLKVGQKLVVPPVDGVSYEVKKGESLSKIAKTYNVKAEDIKKQNHLVANVVPANKEIFIPGAAPVIKDVVRTTPSRTSTKSRTNKSVKVGKAIPLASAVAAPSGVKTFIRPTKGIRTQGYHRGHYAVDIADRSMPPVWAADDGVVVKASSGTWGGGYGNHVIIDHGNGLKTLYAHFDYLTVKVGDHVKQGQVIGRMGRTGRVYGVTGIHLHFEVRKNGVKQVPYNYY